MRGKPSAKQVLPWVTILIGTTGLLAGIPSPIAGQANPPQSIKQSAELEEAKRLNQKAGQLYQQGQYSAAIPLAERALAIAEKALGLEHPAIATSLNNLALLYLAQGNYAKAAPLYQRALAIWEKALGPEHPHTATSLNNLAGLYDAQGDTARALEFGTRGTNIEEENLALILTTGSEADKRAYMATLSSRTSMNISQHIQRAPDHPEAARLALTTVLRRKGRILDAVIDSLQILRQNLSPEDQKLLNQLAATRSQLAARLFKGTNLPSGQYHNQVASLRVKAEKLEDTLARRSAEFRAESQPVTLEAVQRLIPADAALVELMWYRPVVNAKATKPDEYWGAARYAAYVLHAQGGPKWVDLGEANPINQAVNQFRQVLQDPSNGLVQVKQVARSLDQKLMQPIRPLLGNSRTVLLSPDSQLNLTPFAALVDENNRYLVENYSISYLSSGRDLLRLQNSSQSRSKPVVVANPDYDQPGNPASVQAVANRSSNNRRSTELSKIEFGALPGTAQEAQAIVPLLPGMKLLTGSQATENAIKRVKGPSILHIATHGFFLEDVELVAPPDTSTLPQDLRSIEVVPRPGARPSVSNLENPLLRSGIALAGFNPRQSGGEDGVLTALETSGLDLNGTKLVVLSACDTGVGDVANGEGVYGLHRALAMAGAESQLISLWKVSDFGTKDLMVSYYRHLMNQAGRSEALRQTQVEMIQNPKYQHPYYWAAFIPSGAWTALGAKTP